MTQPKDGTYYTGRHLLGGEPDVNKRFIYCWPEETRVATFHPTGAEGEWTKFDNRRLNAIVDMLNDESRFDPTLKENHYEQ